MIVRVEIARDGEPVGSPLELGVGRHRLGDVELDVSAQGVRLIARAPVQLDGVALAVGDARAVGVPSRLSLGVLSVAVSPSTAARPSSPLRTASLARALVRDLLAQPAPSATSGATAATVGGAAVAAIWLEVEAGPGRGSRRAVASRCIIGRGADADWVFADEDLSRHHAVIEVDARGVRVRDLGSKNGTRVDDAAVPTGGLALAEGAVVALGGVRLRRLVAATPAVPAPGPLPGRFWWALALAVVCLGAATWILASAATG